MFKINGKTEVYAAIGDPIAHSFSPQMQNQAFQALGLNAVYIPLHVSANNLPKLLDSIKTLNLKGFNVTLPHKQTIIPFLDQLTLRAAKVQSVNTVYQNENKWIGDSTDGPGFLYCLQHCPVDYKTQLVQILGAGGSACAIAFELAEQGVSTLYIQNRTQSKADALAQRLLKHYPNLKVQTKLATEEIHLLINATSIGLDQQNLPIEAQVLNRCTAVIDILYPKSPLLELCQKLGKWHQSGTPMLCGQGAIAFEIWTKKPAPKEIMYQALLEQIG